ncbi:S-adenosyl-l-methionine hydroxide adenosyltransferase family protein [Candidatus Riflebacteria bacterium]
MNTDIISLISDFGNKDPFAGIMKGVILSINREVTVIDLCHEIPAQDILKAAICLNMSYTFFSANSLHVVVVDPGVGGKRKIIFLRTPGGCFLAPDNGVLSLVLQRGFEKMGDYPVPGNITELPSGFEAFKVDNKDFWLKPTSSSFHGRDIFAPVAAHYSLGVPLEKLATPCDAMLYRPLPLAKETDGVIEGLVIYVDHFGNLVTNITAKMLAHKSTWKFRIGKLLINGLCKFYGEGRDYLALIGSHGYLEIARKNGNAFQSLGIKSKQEVIVEDAGGDD